MMEAAVFAPTGANFETAKHLWAPTSAEGLWFEAADDPHIDKKNSQLQRALVAHCIGSDECPAESDFVSAIMTGAIWAAVIGIVPEVRADMRVGCRIPLDHKWALVYAACNEDLSGVLCKELRAGLLRLFAPITRTMHGGRSERTFFFEETWNGIWNFSPYADLTSRSIIHLQSFVIEGGNRQFAELDPHVQEGIRKIAACTKPLLAKIAAIVCETHHW